MGFTLKFDTQAIRKKLEAAALKQIDVLLSEMEREERCPEHNEKPTITRKGTSLDSQSVTIKACCDPFRDSVLARIKKKFQKSN